MPQRLRFFGVRRGSPPGTREEMEVGERRGKRSVAGGFPAPAVGFPAPAVGFLHVSPLLLQQGRDNGAMPLLLASSFVGSAVFGPVIEASVLARIPQGPQGGYVRYPDSGISYFLSPGFVFLVLFQHSLFRVVSDLSVFNLNKSPPANFCYLCVALEETSSFY